MFLGVQSYQTSVWVFELLMVQKSGQPVEVGSLSHYLQGFQQHPRLFRISEPSTGCLGTSGIILGFCIPPQRFFFCITSHFSLRISGVSSAFEHPCERFSGGSFKNRRFCQVFSRKNRKTKHMAFFSGKANVRNLWHILIS